MYYSLFDNSKQSLDIVCNRQSIQDCAKEIRSFAKSDHDAELIDNLNDKQVIYLWYFTLFAHQEPITEPTGTSRKEIEQKYSISIINCQEDSL